MWLGSPAGADPVYIQYDFDRIYKMHEMLVWNYNVQFEPVLGFGLKEVSVEYSADGETWTSLGDIELAQRIHFAIINADIILQDVQSINLFSGDRQWLQVAPDIRRQPLERTAGHIRQYHGTRRHRCAV